jgi:nitrite reductase (NADH) small subunit
MTQLNSRTSWASVCALEDLYPGSGACVLVGGRQIAVFRVGESEIFALDNFDPASQANVLSRGIVGDLHSEKVVASPIYKHHFSLTTGRCLDDP